MAGTVAEVGDLIVDKDEALQVSGGCGPLDDPLAPLRRQIRILCRAVEALVLSMLDIQAHSHPGRAIRTGLVGDPVPTHLCDALRLCREQEGDAGACAKALGATF